MKRFFYASLGILALAISFHLGASSVGAFSSGQVAAGGGNGFVNWIVTVDGDVYYGSQPNGNPSNYPWTYDGNIFDGATATKETSWSDVKESFR